MSLNNLSNINIQNPTINPNVNSLNVVGSSTTGGNVSVKGNILLPATNQAQTVGVLEIASQSALQAYDGSGSSGNIFVGLQAGANTANMTSSATGETGVGMDALRSLTTGGNNTAVGWRAGACSSGGSNTYLGALAGGNALGTGSNNIFCGYFSGGSVTSGGSNSALGYASLNNLVTGSTNTVLGASSGGSYVGAESNNILVNNVGVAGESGMIRIGTSGTQLLARIAGNLVSAETFVASTAVAGSVIPASAVLAGGCLGYTSATSFVTDTGANIDTAIPNLVAGDVVKCLVMNQTSGALTITAGASGITLAGAGTPTVPANSSRLLYFRKTGAGAYTVY